MNKKSGKVELKNPGISDDKGSSGDSAAPGYIHLGSAPTPKEAEKAEDKVVKKEAPVPVAPKPCVPLRVWISVSGIKKDRLAGFLRFAQLEEMRPVPISEWKTRYEAFLKRPTR